MKFIKVSKKAFNLFIETCPIELISDSFAYPTIVLWDKRIKNVYARYDDISKEYEVRDKPEFYGLTCETRRFTSVNIMKRHVQSLEKEKNIHKISLSREGEEILKVRVIRRDENDTNSNFTK